MHLNKLQENTVLQEVLTIADPLQPDLVPIERRSDMKLLIAFIFASQAFSGYHNQLQEVKYVASIEEAAILLWQYNKTVTYPEPIHYELLLAEIGVEENDCINIVTEEPCGTHLEFTGLTEMQVPEVWFKKDTMYRSSPH